MQLSNKRFRRLPHGRDGCYFRIQCDEVPSKRYGPLRELSEPMKLYIIQIFSPSQDQRLQMYILVTKCIVPGKHFALGEQLNEI